MSTAVEPALLEREEELHVLAAAVADVRDGRGRLVVVEAPAGMGKTRLLRETRAIAQRAGLQPLAARGTELERDFPFSVVRQLFEPALVAADPERRVELLSGTARRAAPVVGLGDGGETRSSDALVDPSFDTLNALYWLVSNVAESGPALLVVDDAHWCDRASLRFLRFLGPRLEDLPVLLLVASRPPGRDDDVAALVAEPAALVVRPRALSGAGVASYVRATLSAGAEDDFCAACADSSGGNPFLLRELLGELAAEGRTGSSGETAHISEVAPASISRAVLLRLSRLPEAARSLAVAVAVLGDDAEPGLAAAFAGLPDDELSEAADALAGAGIFERDALLRFAHPIVRTAVHADLPAGQRAAAHARAARLLAAAGAEPERVAVHLLATDPGTDPAVAETLLAAGERAIRRAAPEAAVSYLRRALDEAPAPELRRRILRQLLTAGFRAGDRAALRGTNPVAELTADPDSLLESASILSMWLTAGGRQADVAELLDRAAAAASAAGDADRALRFAAQRVSWTHLPPAEAQALLAPYAERAGAGSSAELLWLGLQAWWTSFLPGGTADRAAQAASRALRGDALFAELSAVPLAAQAILVLIWAERFAAAEPALERYVAAARESAPNLAHAAYLRGELAFRRGEVARAAADAQATVDIGREGGFLLTVPVWLALRIDTLIELDQPAAAEAELAAAGMTGAIPETYWFAALRFARGRLHLARGRHQEAVDDFLAGERVVEAGGMVCNHEPWGAPAALALAALGRGEDAHELLDRVAAGAREWGTTAALTAVTRARGLIAGGEEGLRLLEAAAGTASGGLEHLRALVDLGAARRRANRRAEAREPLRTALELARRGGATALARRAYDELAATGERVRPLGVSGVESLTPSERRITAMAAHGHTNREIAQELFLTVKTIETHLLNAYRKLDIHSRAELEAALRG